MPVQQDQNRILDRLQGAVVTDITNAIAVSGTTDAWNERNVVAAIGSLAGGQSTNTDGSAVANKATGRTNLALVLGIVGLVVVVMVLH